jgi:hypothetical protein
MAASSLSISLLIAIACIPAAERIEPPGLVRAIRVLPDRAPDCTSLPAIVASVTRGCSTDDEKAVALYNFLNLALYHFQYPNEPKGISALKLINSYGWSLCGGEHTVEAALWKTAGWKWRYVGWSDPGHTTVEAFYGGSWHYLDVFLRFYAWRPDPAASNGRTIASQADLRASPAILQDGFVLDPARKVVYRADNRAEMVGDVANWTAPAFLVCGDDIPGIVSGINHSNQAGSPEGWNAIVFDDPSYSADVDLAPGWSLTVQWDPIPGGHWFSGRGNAPGHTCGDKDYRNCPAIGPILEPYRSDGQYRRTFGSGRLVFAPDLSGEACLGSFASSENVRVEAGALVPADPGKAASVTVLLRSPYVLARARAAAEGIDRAEVSTDGGKSFAPADPANLDDAVGGKYEVLLRLGLAKALRTLRVEATVQCNPSVLPFLSPGKNEVSVSVADPARLGANRLAVTYAYRTGERSKSYAGLLEEDKEVARGHGARWSKEITVVRKVFAAGDLPAKFEISVPTPKGSFPVYPRMVFLRREVLAPGAKPMDLPEGAVEPRAGAADEYPSLPEPFLIGIAKPPPRAVRPTSARTVDLRRIGFVDATGAVSQKETLRWPKNPNENVVPRALILEGDLGALPAPRDIAAARLVVPVSAGHDKAPGQLGAVLLAAPIEPGKPIDMKSLGDVAGVSVISLQPKDRPEYRPPLPFSIDVTRAVKSVAAGSVRFHGFALRIVPNRAVDDGWTVRADIPPEAKIVLEIEVYAR